jgi:predicted aldo/keto reductase-like oxidoreductase
MRYQQSWSSSARVTEASQRNLQATIDRALALGIDHIETARGYGTSEAQLGPALARHPRGSFILQTKVRPADRAREFTRALEESLARLRVEHVDLFAFHGVNTRRCLEQIFDGGCLAAAEALRRDGRIRHIGFSTHGPTRLIVDAIATGRFDYVNLHYYYVFQDNRPALAAARAQDMGVFIISPTDKGGRLQAAPEKLRRLCAPLSPIAFNDLWCLAHDDIHTLSLGAARPGDFDEHVDAVARLAHAPSLLPPIVERLEAAYRDAVGDDFARRWRDGLREWDELPGRMNVRRILWLYNLVRAYDLVEFAQERYAAMSPDDHWVPGGHGDAAAPEAVAAALPDSPFRAQLASLLRDAHRRLHDPDAEPLP